MNEETKTEDRPTAGNVKLSVPTREGMEQAMKNWDADTPYFEAERQRRLRDTMRLYERGGILYRLGLNRRQIQG